MTIGTPRRGYSNQAFTRLDRWSMSDMAMLRQLTKAPLRNFLFRSNTANLSFSQLALLHGGNVEIASKVGEGTRVTLRVPVSPLHNADPR